MEIDEILEAFTWFDGKFKREAVEAAIERREEVTPELLTILEELIDLETALKIEEDGEYMAHFYAMFLLAQFRETRAYAPLVKIAQWPSDLIESFFGDCITQSLGKVLASVCDGDLGGIQSVIENAEADRWARGAALGALVALVASGQKSREEILAYFAELFHGKLTDKDEIVWSELVCYTTDLFGEELLGEIEKAYQLELVDPSFIGLDDVHHDLAQGLDWAMERLAKNPHRKLVTNTVKEMGWWASFHETKQPAAPSPGILKSTWTPALPEFEKPPVFKPLAKKVGRNEPCPCGSGKKYKKCCGQSL